MSKQRIEFTLGFKADTAQAQRELETLASSLKKLSTSSPTILDGKQFNEASQAAFELEQHLEKAVNVNTGKLDLTKFASSLRSSGKDLQHYQQKLSQLGPEGKQAFNQLARSIANAEVPTVKINKHLASFLTTLKNTAKWQLTSNITHGLQSGLQQALSYAESLNKSLVDIQIVTSMSTAEMAKFAEQANKVARTLSVSTTDYTKASLIYFQQGLDEKEVEARAGITSKMAAVTGQTTETISDQLTAIWNNFYDGSKSLEYYADVLTRLGADTASSSDEIVQGLQKFSAVADTIGLSYEYAAASLATITSTTRESADVVGTALKTLFSRIQGLKLGETLEDGVDLNKYSEALDKVGVKVLNQNGELREMDAILDDLAAKWDTLNKAQQTSLAQTVAGVRQYTQLIALMDNWDFMQQNVQSGMNSEGSLNEQFSFYEQGVEASAQRVQTALQNIYSSLIDDQFLVQANNALTEVIDGMSGFIDVMGGLPGIITTISTILLSTFASKVPAALNGLGNFFRTTFGIARKETYQLQDATQEYIQTQLKATTNPVEQMELHGLEKLLEMRKLLTLEAKNMTVEEQEAYKIDIERVQKIYEMVKVRTQDAEVLKSQLADQVEMMTRMAGNNTNNLSQAAVNKGRAFGAISQSKAFKQWAGDREDVGAGDFIKEAEAGNITGLTDKDLARIERAKKAMAELEAVKQKGAGSYQQGAKEARELTQEIEKLGTKYGTLTVQTKQTAQSIAAMGDSDSKLGSHASEVDKMIQNFKKLAQEAGFTDEEIKHLLQDVDLFDTSGLSEMTIQKASQNFDQLTQNMYDYQMAGKGSEENTQALSGKLAKLQQITGASDEQMQEFTATLLKEGVTTEELRLAFEKLNDTPIKPPKHFTQVSQAVASMGSALVSMGMQISSITSAWDTLSDDSASAATKIGAFASAAFSATFMIREFGKGWKDTIDVLSKSSKYVDKAAEMTAKAAKNGGKVTNIFAKMGTTVSEAGVATVSSAGAAAAALGPVLIAAAAVVAAIVAIVVAHNNWKKAAQESAKAANEELKANQELIDKNKELSDSMREALVQYKESKDNKQELDDATIALAEAYGIEGAAIAALTGDLKDYETVLERVKELQKEEFNEQAKQAEYAKGQALDAVVRTSTGGTFDDWHLYGDKLDLAFGGYGAGESQFVDIATSMLAEAGIGTERYAANSGFHLELDTNNIDELILAYEKLDEIQSEARKQMGNEAYYASGTSKEIDKWQAEIKEYIDLLKEAQDSEKAAKLQASGLQYDLDNVKSYEEYVNWVNKAKQELGDLYNSEEEFQKLLAQLESYSGNNLINTFHAYTEKLDQLKSKLTETDEEVDKFWNSLSEEEKTILMSMDIDYGTTLDKLNEYIAKLSKNADVIKLQVEFEEYSKALSLLTDDGKLSVEDAEKIKELIPEAKDWDWTKIFSIGENWTYEDAYNEVYNLIVEGAKAKNKEIQEKTPDSIAASNEVVNDNLFTKATTHAQYANTFSELAKNILPDDNEYGQKNKNNIIKALEAIYGKEIDDEEIFKEALSFTSSSLRNKDFTTREKTAQNIAKALGYDNLRYYSLNKAWGYADGSGFLDADTSKFLNNIIDTLWNDKNKKLSEEYFTPYKTSILPVQSKNTLNALDFLNNLTDEEYNALLSSDPRSYSNLTDNAKKILLNRKNGGGTTVKDIESMLLGKDDLLTLSTYIASKSSQFRYSGQQALKTWQNSEALAQSTAEEVAAATYQAGLDAMEALGISEISWTIVPEVDERYLETSDLIENVTDELNQNKIYLDNVEVRPDGVTAQSLEEEIQKAEDDLFGENGYYKRLKDEAEGYAKQDYAGLKTVMDKLNAGGPIEGFESISFDEETQTLKGVESVYQALNAAKEKVEKDATLTDKQREDKLTEIDNYKTLIEYYVNNIKNAQKQWNSAEQAILDFKLDGIVDTEAFEVDLGGLAYDIVAWRNKQAEIITKELEEALANNDQAQIESLYDELVKIYTGTTEEYLKPQLEQAQKELAGFVQQAALGSIDFNSETWREDLTKKVNSKLKALEVQYSGRVLSESEEKEYENKRAVYEDILNTMNLIDSTEESIAENAEKIEEIFNDIRESNYEFLKDIYTEIDLLAAVNEELSEQERIISRIQKERDSKYGQAYLDSIEKENKALDKQIELQEKAQAQNNKLAKYYSDQTNMKGAVYGYTNEDGTLKSLEDITIEQENKINELKEALKKAEDAQTKANDAVTEAQKALDDAKLIGDKTKISEAQTALSNAQTVKENADKAYNATHLELSTTRSNYSDFIGVYNKAQDYSNAFEDSIDAAAEAARKQLENNFERWNYTLELGLEVNDRDLEMLEYKLGKIDDDIYSVGEAWTLTNQQVASHFTGFDVINQSYENLTNLFNAGQIAPAKYAEGLKSIYSEAMEGAKSLDEIDEKMRTFYSDTLDLAIEQIDKYASALEHQTSVLEHYYNLITLINGEADYEKIGMILEGQAKTLENEMKFSTEQYQNAVNAQTEYQAFFDTLSDEDKKKYQANLDAINEQVREAEEEMLSDTEAWAEKLKEILENKMAEAGDILEKTFSGGMGFDSLNNSIDRLNDYQDIYLTKTNQVYEIQKLMRTAQQAADKTDNAAAKQRINNFVQETKKLQEKNKLSHLELEIQQAQYDMLMAQIALEEAKNAKTTVRLRRDSQGNFGYVYTADQEQVAKAEQELADAENRLYNISLEATNEWGQKRLELQQQYADAITELEERRANKEFETDEMYQQERDRITQEFYRNMEAYAGQYTIALNGHANTQADAWIRAYEDMMAESDKWNEATTQYLDANEKAYGEWKDEVAKNSAIVDGVLKNTQTEVQKVTDKSEELRKKGNEVAISMWTQVSAAQGAQKEYINLSRTVDDLRLDYLNMAAAAQSALDQISKINSLQMVNPYYTTYKNTNEDLSSLMTQHIVNGGQIGDMKWEALTQIRDEKIQANGNVSAFMTNAQIQQILSDYTNLKDSNPNALSVQWVNAILGGQAHYTPENYQKFIEELEKRNWIPGIKLFDTGGYTGEWGPQGRLAVVHEKELILKQDDTANFLLATGMLRNIASMIDLNAANSLLATGLQNPLAAAAYAPGTLDQNVTIEAHFPNATDRDEITEAFNTLINTASQYANRKTK